MDIQRQVTEQSRWKRYWYVLPIVIVVMTSYFLQDLLGNASYITEKNALVTAIVEQGDFRVNVRATGVLKPVNIRWVSSQVSGRVEQVMVKPGDHVKAGDVLMRLSQPDLHRELEKARWELKAHEAESHATYLVLESQLVDLENSVIAANYNYQSAKFKLDAETELMSQGNATVSALDYQKSQLAVKQQKQYWLAQQQKTEKMKANLQATKAAHIARTGLVNNNYQRVQQQVEALQIRATNSGVLQQVSLELGEQAKVGDSVALIADQQSLFAELQVQEVRARDIALGQSVLVDTRTTEMFGKVMRIDPSVKSGMVQVDVELTSHLPSEARPELSVDGLIEINHIANALFVKRPVYAPRNTTMALFKLTADQKFADRQLVSLGLSSVNKIQILSGLNTGDEIIISDTKNWGEHQQIMIH